MPALSTPTPRHWLRRLSAATVVPALLVACTAQALSPIAAPLPTPPLLWPEPQADLSITTTQRPYAPVLNLPNFKAPAASHCARPIQTREIPGRPAQSQSNIRLERERGRAYDSESRMFSKRAEMASSASADARASAAPAVAAEAAMPAPPSAPVPSAHLQRQPAPLQKPRPGPITAGMVDDNADFNEYLAFRERTQVQHRARDIRERHLLVVRDPQGRGVADAEVLVRSAQGHAMWARTDTQGRVWIHANAFDPAQAQVYDVLVRKGGQQAQGFLRRGQKSAMELSLQVSTTPGQARLDLVFLIDATGSMADEIDKLKASLQSIAREVAQLPSKPDLCFGLVAYRDKGDQFLLRSHDFTNDLNAFQGVLNALRAGGGGDYPEAMSEALHETVHQLNWRGDGATRMVVLLADAPPHLDYGGPEYDDDMLAALGKGIKVFSVGASGLDKQGEFIQRQIAQYTGGRFVFLTYADAARPGSGPGRETVHDVSNYSVQTLDRLIVRLVRDELAPLQP